MLDAAVRIIISVEIDRIRIIHLIGDKWGICKCVGSYIFRLTG